MGFHYIESTFFFPSHSLAATQAVAELVLFSAKSTQKLAAENLWHNGSASHYYCQIF